MNKPLRTILLLLLTACGNEHDSAHSTELRREFYADGTIKSEVETSNNKRHGKYTAYYPDGKIKAEGYFLDDLIHDTVTFYHQNGQLKGIQAWKLGVPIGVQTFYDSTGYLLYDLFHKLDSSQTFGRSLHATKITENVATPHDFVLFTNPNDVRPIITINDRQNFLNHDTNLVHIIIPNIPTFWPAISKGNVMTLRNNQFYIIPQENVDTVQLRLICVVNDTTIILNPIKIPVQQ